MKSEATSEQRLSTHGEILLLFRTVELIQSWLTADTTDIQFV